MSLRWSGRVIGHPGNSTSLLRDDGDHPLARTEQFANLAGAKVDEEGAADLPAVGIPELDDCLRTSGDSDQSRDGPLSFCKRGDNRGFRGIRVQQDKLWWW